MDFVGTILMSVAGGVGAQVGHTIFNRLKIALAESLSDKSDNKIFEALQAIGNLSDGDIRRRVDELTRLKKLTTIQAEELTALLINLAHGTRFHTTHGTPRSSFLRCERLLDQLLTHVLPKRRKGEMVAENGMPGWSLTRFLGMGSFGEVWEAHNPGYPETRAVKFFTRPDAQKWITAEQETLFHVQAKLSKHPNIVSFLDVALNGKPFPYLLLEYANGGSLEDWILSHPKDRISLDARTLMDGIVRGLAEAHQNHIAHRDLKPANIMLANAATGVIAKIADFGLGRVELQGKSAPSQASQGLVVGTSLYLPPEALQPFVRRSPEKDDVFALGVIWYQLLTGKLERPPYDFAERLREHLADSQTIRLIERCLAQPDRRFRDACQLQLALEALPLMPTWLPPSDCFDVQHIAREYLASKAQSV